MKKATKLLLALVAVAAAIAAGIGIYIASPLLAMRPAKTGEIPGTGIYAIRNNRNALYFVKAEGGYILIDAGSDAAKAEASLKEAGIAPEDVKWILLTHSDYDHVAALPLFPGAEIYMSDDEFHSLGRPPRNNRLPAGITIEENNLLSDGQELNLGGIRVICFKAPGHTVGSMAYLMEDCLFTGDALRLRKQEMLVHPFTVDAARAEATIERLKEMPHSVLLTAHYGYTTTNESGD